jgi:acyl-coenzyme A thioesterase PaaI-like protein
VNNPALPGVPMTFADGEVWASLELSEIYQGPRGSGHGGMLSCLMDTLLASLVQQQGLKCVTASLAVDYRARTPLHRPLHLHGRLLGTEGRKVRAVGTISADGRVTVEATGVFVRVAER